MISISENVSLYCVASCKAEFLSDQWVLLLYYHVPLLSVYRSETTLEIISSEEFSSVERGWITDNNKNCPV